MDTDDENLPGDFVERSRAASEMLERSLMKAVNAVEIELARVVRTGEADLDRLARSIVETLAKLALDNILDAKPERPETPGHHSETTSSFNQLAAAVARAARRGARFS